MADVSAAPAAPSAPQTNGVAKPPQGAAPIAGKPIGKGNAGVNAPSTTPAPAEGAKTETAAPKAPDAPAAEDRYWERMKPMKVGDETIDFKAMNFKNAAAFEAYIQKDLGGSKKLREAAKVREDSEKAIRERDELIRLAKEDPAAFLEYAGHKRDDLAVKWLSTDYERDQQAKALAAKGYSPEDIKRLQEYESLKAQTETQAQQRAEQEARQKAAQEQQAAQQAEQEYRTKIIDTAKGAIEALGFDAQGVHKDFAAEFLFPEVRNIMRAADVAGIELTPDRVAAELDDRMRVISKHALSGLKGPALLKAVGQETLAAIVAAIREAKSLPQATATPAVGAVETPPEAPPMRRPTAAEQRERLATQSSVNQTQQRGQFRWNR